MNSFQASPRVPIAPPSPKSRCLVDSRNAESGRRRSQGNSSQLPVPVLKFDVKASNRAATPQLESKLRSEEFSLRSRCRRSHDHFTRPLLFERRFCVSNKACDAIYGLESLFASSSTRKISRSALPTLGHIKKFLLTCRNRVRAE